MILEDAQKQRVAEWIADGMKLSEIQSKLDAEFGVRMTYMEVRFLMDDLSLKPVDPVPPPEEPAAAAQTAGEPPDAGEAPAGLGGVSVSVDHVTRPGSVVSGRVTFSDGVASEWYLDQMGRLGLVPSTPGYKPSEEDVMSFQTQLQQQLSKQGF